MLTWRKTTKFVGIQLKSSFQFVTMPLLVRYRRLYTPANNNIFSPVQPKATRSRFWNRMYQRSYSKTNLF